MNDANEAAGQPRWIDPKQGRDAVAHGFRSTFRDWAAGQTTFPSEIAEAALAHAKGDKTEMQRDMFSAAGVIDGVVRSSDLLVDITDTDGKVSPSVPLWEAIGDDEGEYQDCRQTLLAEGKCTRRRRCGADILSGICRKLDPDRQYIRIPAVPFIHI